MRETRLLWNSSEKAKGNIYCCKNMYTQNVNRKTFTFVDEIQETEIVEKELKVDSRISERLHSDLVTVDKISRQL